MGNYWISKKNTNVKGHVVFSFYFTNLSLNLKLLCQVLSGSEPNAVAAVILQRRQLHMRSASGGIERIAVQNTALPSRRFGPSGTGPSSMALFAAQH